MLVLTRKQSQRIRLGDSIVITVVRIAGDKVRLGIEAPRGMLVLREELEAFDSSGEPPAWTEFASDDAARTAEHFANRQPPQGAA